MFLRSFMHYLSPGEYLTSQNCSSSCMCHLNGGTDTLIGSHSFLSLSNHIWWSVNYASEISVLSGSSSAPSSHSLILCPPSLLWDYSDDLAAAQLAAVCPSLLCCQCDLPLQNLRCFLSPGIKSKSWYTEDSSQCCRRFSFWLVCAISHHALSSS